MSTSPVNGGAPARRAVLRWTVRLVRRDWRQHLVIIALITVATAVGAALTTTAYNLAPASGQAEFGDADHAILFDRGQDSTPIPEWLQEWSTTLGPIDPIGHRNVGIPGSVGALDYRTQAVGGAYSAPLLAVVGGRAPVGDGEVALTDGAATTLSATIGDTIGADGVDRVVVGLVENPSDLDDEFVLLPLSAIGDSNSVRLLVVANDAMLGADDHGPMVTAARSEVPEDVMAGVLMLLATTVLLVLVGLVTSASFAVIAQRRLPQLGMLSAIGATERHIRLSMSVSGALTGVVSAVVGAALGIGAWLVGAASLESIVHHRIDVSNIPWWFVLAGVVLATAAATAAAWWPARAMARIPTVVALSGRTPRPARTERSAAVAVVSIVAGVGALRHGTNFAFRGPDAFETIEMVVGTIAVIVGVLLVAPVLIRLLGRLAQVLPLAGRLALRDLGRHQARSSAAVAAVGLALGIPAVIMVATTAVQNADPLGNLASDQVIVHADEIPAPFVPDAARIEEMQGAVDQIALALGDANALRLDAVVNPEVVDANEPGHATALAVGRPFGNGMEFVATVYFAAPVLLDSLGLQQDDVDGRGIVTRAQGDLVVAGAAPDNEAERVPFLPIDRPGTLAANYGSLPGALCDSSCVTDHGWSTAPSGDWLIRTGVAPTAEQLVTARQIAARYGVFVETRDVGTRLPTIRLAAGLVGMLLALGVLAATVGLIRSESANETRALTAAGATRSTRRGITAVTAGSLAAVGAVLGVATAYVGLSAGRLGHLTPLPWIDLILIAVGTPVIATVVGWLMAGREPVSIARRPLD